MPKIQRRLRSRQARTGERDDSKALAAAAAADAEDSLVDEEEPKVLPRLVPKVTVVTAEDQASAEAALQHSDPKLALKRALEEKRRRKRQDFYDSLLNTNPKHSAAAFRDRSPPRLLMSSQACQAWYESQQRSQTRRHQQRHRQEQTLLCLLGRMQRSQHQNQKRKARRATARS